MSEATQTHAEIAGGNGEVRMKVSVVIPCYRSEATIAKVVTMTRQVLVDGGYDYEFVLVNDGSPDGTFAQIRALAEADPRVKGIDLVRNFGQHGAIMAGLHHTTGQLVLLMDDDMQTHPSQVMRLLDKVYEGWDVVFADYGDEGLKESWFRRAGSRFAEWTSRTLTGSPKDVYATSFFVMRDYVRDHMISYTGPYPYIEGLVFRATKSVTSVPVKHFDREVGTSGYTLKALVRLWSSILGLSVVPLRLAAALGGVLALVGLVWAIAIVVERLCGVVTMDGWSSIMATQLLLFGVVLVFLGLIGEYLGRLSLTVGAQPQFEVRSALNCPDGVDQDARFVKPRPRAYAQTVSEDAQAHAGADVPGTNR